VSHAAYVFGGWAATVAVLGVYAVRLVARERRLARRVPPGERRWG
jgi:hypothetical protein